jgi:hypothetical protein
VPPATTTPGPTDPPGTPPAITLKINFQPDSAAQPTGYLKDSGAAYGDRANGYTYGWNANNSANTRDRNSSRSVDQRYDTLIYMQRGALYTWEVALPNGAYQVRIIAGDASYYSSVYKINAEGVLLVNGTPSRSIRWVEGVGTVLVNDGRLTITNASGASNNKLSFIEISKATGNVSGVNQPPVASSPAAFSVAFTPADSGLQLSWAQGEAAATYQIYRSDTGDRSAAVDITSDWGELTPTADGVYNVVDSTASSTATYHYWLSVTDSSGRVSESGPIMQGAEDRVFAVFLPAVAR